MPHLSFRELGTPSLTTFFRPTEPKLSQIVYSRVKIRTQHLDSWLFHEVNN